MYVSGGRRNGVTEIAGRVRTEGGGRRSVVQQVSGLEDARGVNVDLKAMSGHIFRHCSISLNVRDLSN